MQPHQDVLVVVAEALAEDVDPAGVLGALPDADTHPDRVVLWQVDVPDRDIRDPNAVNEGAGLGDAPSLQLAILRALQFPPARRVDATLIAVVTWRRPGAYLDVI